MLRSMIFHMATISDRGVKIIGPYLRFPYIQLNVLNFRTIG